ncbi:MAG: sulfotransferase [Paracoccaceae bacterium]
MTRKPFGNLFINAGAMKAGTTWVYWALRFNKHLYFSLEKEVHYFHRKYIDSSILNDVHRVAQVKNLYVHDLMDEKTGIEEMREYARWLTVYLRSPMNDDWYAEVIRPPGNQTWSCDFSNLYAQLPAWAWKDISASCAQLRVLFMLRDPLHRLWSHLKFDLKYNGQLDQLPDWSPQQVSDYLRQPHIWHNAEYGEAIRRLQSGLNAPQVKFMFMPERHTDALGFLRDVEQFVGVPEGVYPPWILRDKVNQSDPMPMPDFFPDLFRTDVDRIKEEMHDAGIVPPQNWL